MIFLLNVLAADENVRHYHRGRLPKYELSPPSIMLSDGDEEALSQGRALMQVIVGEDGERRRLLMVRDVGTPARVVSSPETPPRRSPQPTTTSPPRLRRSRTRGRRARRDRRRSPES